MFLAKSSFLARAAATTTTKTTYNSTLSILYHTNKTCPTTIIHPFSTNCPPKMSTPPNQDSPSEPQSQSEQQSTPLALPPTSSSSESKQPTQIPVDGQAIKLDHLGPLVVNKDGTLSRISNWAQMTEGERKNTLRILGKRNQIRLEGLRGEEGGEGEEGK